MSVSKLSKKQLNLIKRIFCIILILATILPLISSAILVALK